jgi:hypothetical protein
MTLGVKLLRHVFIFYIHALTKSTINRTVLAQRNRKRMLKAEQKPLAVSRDQSPTDTSGPGSEFSPFG